MKKYYKANLGGDVRCVVADTSEGRISVFYVNNGKHMLLEGIYSTVIDPSTQTSEFESRLDLFTECSLADIQSNLDFLKTHVNSL